MIQFFSKRTCNKKGFTLVELLIVIAILGILYSVAIPKLGQYRRDAHETASLAKAATIYNARSTYLARNGPDKLSTMTDEILSQYLADGEVPDYIGGELDDTGYGIKAVFVRDANGEFTIGYPEAKVTQFETAAEALASITTDSFSQTNDTSLWISHAGRTGFNCPDVTINGTYGGYTVEFVQNSIQEWDTDWENGTGDLIPGDHIYYKNAVNLKFITKSSSGISGTFVLRATKDTDTDTITINYSQAPMVDNEVPKMEFD